MSSYALRGDPLTQQSNRGTTRPVEVMGLLNPAFTGTLLTRTIGAYNQQSHSEFPFALSFLLLPIIMHPPTRRVLPTRISAHMHAWLQNHSEIRVGFAQRARG